MAVKISPVLRNFGRLGFGIVFLIFACTLVGNENNSQKFSFNKSYDTLAQFDSVVITLRDTSGRTIDILYKGKADTVREIENLPAPHWDGSGIVIVSVVGFQSGEMVYRVDKKLNGKNDQVLDTIRVILPGTLLKSDQLNWNLTEGDSVSLPKISVTPLELSDKSITFSVSDPALLQIGPGFLRALQKGAVDLTATLNSNPAKSLIIHVLIVGNPLTPESLVLSPETLTVAANGAVGAFSVKVLPTSADPGVTWYLVDSSLATFDGAGTIQGLKAGKTKVIAVSKREPSLADTSFLIVAPQAAVASVRFLKDSLDLFVGGAAESLLVEVLPALANPKVDISISDAAIAGISGGRVRGLAEGKALVIAKSQENPTFADSLRVTVLPTQKIDSVRLAPDTLRLYTGGAPGTTSAKVFPLSANQSLLWRAGNPGIAKVDGAGKTSPVAPGQTRITALSRVDSTRQDSALVLVKRDVPLLNVGRDTVLSLGASLAVRPAVSQEYGGVIQFRWDLNGDGTFEGASDSLRQVSSTFNEAKEIKAAFYVKDSEGNDTTVFKKIRVVAGPAVLILSPLDSTYTRLFSIDVAWSVNGKEQDSLKKQVLKIGTNTVSRSAKDEAGNLYSTSVTVFVDTVPPSKPVVRGSLITNSQMPAWTWASGGGGGSGEFRYWLDVDDSSKGKGIIDTAYIPPTELPEGLHTFFVAERDKAGNWSQAGRFSTRIDLTPPSVPNVTLAQATPTNNPKPGWKWTSGGGGGGGKGLFRYKLEDELWSTGLMGSVLTFKPSTNISDGSHILYVQEQDSAGNWSKSGSASLVVDVTPPNPPKIDSLPYSPLNTLKPHLSWKSGGGIKIYRSKMDASDLTSVPENSDSVFTQPENLAEGVHTLYVQERDEAGNWSEKASRKLVLIVRRILGTGAVSDFGPSSQSALDIDRRGNVFVAYNEKIGETDDGSSIIRPGVKRLNGIIWEMIGNVTGFGSGIFSDYGISIDGNGIPYVGIRDSLNRATVIRYSGTQWQVVGSSGFTPENSGEYSLGVSPANIPYVFFSDKGVNRKGTVLKFNGTSWEAVGPRGFSLANIIFTRIVFGSSGTPFLAYVDAEGCKILRFAASSASWEPVGNLNVHSEGGYPVNLFMSSRDSLFVSMTTMESGGKGHVFKFNGSTWESVGDAAFESGVATMFKLASTSEGDKYIAFVDKTNGDRLTFKGLKDNKWVPMGPAAFPSFAGGMSRLILDSLGVVHVAAEDYSNGGKTVLQNAAFEP